MPDVIFPSKLVTERITVEFNFLDLMEWAETITSASFEVSLFTGVDPTPQDILYQTVIINSPRVRHRIQLGVPGVIYNLLCRVVGSTGNVYKKYGRLAILPSAAGFPPFFATYYTTPPYSADEVDAMEFAMLPLSGILHTVIYTTTTRAAMSFGMLPLSGTMGPILQTTNTVGKMSFAMIPLSGIMETILITYPNLTEKMSFAMVPVSGILDTQLVENNTTGKMSFAMIPLSGTMTS